jgi:glutamine synthetase
MRSYTSLPSLSFKLRVFDILIIQRFYDLSVKDVLREVAEKHGLTCLLHEKPFSYINGSGKHINWSLETDKRENLLDPGSTPIENARFMVC